MDLNKLANEIIDGRRLTREDDLSFLIDCNLDELSKEADRLREHFSGNAANLCAIIAGKGGRCPENCRFCAQSSHNPTGCETFELLDYDTIYKAALRHQNDGVHRFAIVNSGRCPSTDEFEKLISIYEKLSEELNISLCASLGFLTDEQFERLFKAGVRRYHNNIETSRSYFPEICTTHTFDDKLRNIKRAQKAGLEVCSGGIIGMGETVEQRIEMALDLSELGVKSIPINALIPIPNTPLANLRPLTEEEIIRAVGIFRMINPEPDIRIAAGRKLLCDNGRKLFTGGANSTITGNMLTTTGSTTEKDLKMFRDMKRL